MRNRLLPLLAAVLAVSCASRIVPTPPDERTTVAGAPLVFGQPGEIPEGTQVIWDFGDGTPPATGTRVTHAFPKQGVYTIVETIRDKDGKERTARTHVSALLRTLPMALPQDVRAALLLPTPWAKVQLHRDTAGKFALGAFFDEMAGAVTEAAGFDALDPKAAEANGFDPQEGVAFFTVPQDPEALLLAVGTEDDAKSLEVVKKLLASPRLPVRGPFQFAESKQADGTSLLLGQNAAGDRIGVLQRFGYLYLRTAGASDPMLSLKSVAAVPEHAGLSQDQGFLNAMRHTGPGDAIFFSRATDSAMRFSNELGASAFALIEKPEVVQFRIFTQLRTVKAEAFKPLRDPPDLASKLPSGASAYLRISAAPDALWRELSRMSGADAARLRDRVHEASGLDLEKDLIPSFAGNVGIAVYLDASSLVEAMMGEEVGSFDRSAFVVAAQLTNEANVQSLLDRAVKARPDGLTGNIAGAAVFKLGDGAVAAIRDGVLFLSLGASATPAETPAKQDKHKPRTLTASDLGFLSQVLQPSAKSSTLSQEFKHIGVQGFQVPGQQNLYLNIAGMVRGIERAGSEKGGLASAGVRLFADRAADLRDALFEARPGKDGVDADLWIRFLNRSAR